MNPLALIKPIITSIPELKQLNKVWDGVYAVYRDDECIYVGYSMDILNRFHGHGKRFKNTDKILVWLDTSPCAEGYFIETLKPKENKQRSAVSPREGVLDLFAVLHALNAKH